MRAATTRYGSSSTPRYDMAGYFMNLKDRATDAAAKAAIDRVLSAHDASIVNWQYEPGSYDGKAHGYSFYTMKNLGAVSEIGPWQVDSLWQAYIAKANGTWTTMGQRHSRSVDP